MASTPFPIASFPIASFPSLRVLFINTTPRPVPENCLLLASFAYAIITVLRTKTFAHLPKAQSMEYRFPNPPSRVTSVRHRSFILIYPTLTILQTNAQAVFACPSEQTRAGAEMNGLIEVCVYVRIVRGIAEEGARTRWHA
jgi:hypothetical protein